MSNLGKQGKKIGSTLGDFNRKIVDPKPRSKNVRSPGGRSKPRGVDAQRRKYGGSIKRGGRRRTSGSR